MKKKLLFIALAGALSAPSAYAAQDTSGMRYTSAAEGFYASIRVRLNSGDTDDKGMNVENSSSRIGIRGSSDIGGGSEFFYQYEMGVGVDNGSGVSTRVGRVGLRGDFGQLQVGSFWAQSYNWVYGSTDIANVNSGNLAYTDALPGRAKQAVEYTTPEMNGFQGAVLVMIDDTSSAAVTEPKLGTMTYNVNVNNTANMTTNVPVSVVAYFPDTTAAKVDDNDIDAMIIAAKYDVQGFSAGVSYFSIPEALKKYMTSGTGVNTSVVMASGREDHTGYAVKLGYAQDNWYANVWYSVDNMSDMTFSGAQTNTEYAAGAAKAEDMTNLSAAGGVSTGKTNLYAVYEMQENVGGMSGMESAYSTLGAQYNFNGKSRVWLEYANKDIDGKPKVGDFFTIGLRHDF